MFTMMSSRTDAGPESLSPFINGHIDDCLLKLMTFSENLLNSFFARLKQVMLLPSVSSSAWRFLTHFRRNSSRIIRITDER